MIVCTDRSRRQIAAAVLVAMYVGAPAQLDVPLPDVGDLTVIRQLIALRRDLMYRVDRCRLVLFQGDNTKMAESDSLEDPAELADSNNDAPAG